MKLQIRRGVFETNSSSVHSLTMCMKSEFDKWVSGDLFLYTGYGFSYPEDKKPITNHFYTKDQVIDFIKCHEYMGNNLNWDNEDEVMDYLYDNEWYDFDYYTNHYSCEYEEFEGHYKTPNGEEIVAFGYYGYD